MPHSLGAYLRELRVARGLSLEQVSRATRVGQRYLKALENEALDTLPAPVFAKGFIRAYCQVLGEPPDEALARYRELVGEPVMSATPAIQPRRPEARGRGPVLISLVLLIVLGLSLFIVTLALQRRAERVTMPAVPPLPPPVAPAVSAGPGSPHSANAAEAQPVHLVARTSEPTWVSVQTDDGRVFKELLPAGATRAWISPKRFILTIGNAGGITLELNGQPLPPLGARGAVIRELVLPQDAGGPHP